MGEGVRDAQIEDLIADLTRESGECSLRDVGRTHREIIHVIANVS